MSDLTQIIITGRDQTKAAFASVTSGLGRLQSGFSSLNAAAGALGAALSVAAVASWAQETIAAASALDDLADATGSTVESLSKLSNIAKVSGADFGTIDQAIKKLAVGLAGTDEESGRAGKALAALGISARDPAQALNEIAVTFDGLADGPKKAALAVDIFGRSGASLLPILKDLAANQDIASTVTTKQAADAERLEQALRRLGVQSSAFKNSLLSDVVPALTAAASSFSAARAAGIGFFDALAMTGNYSNGGIVQAVSDARKNVDALRDSFNRYTSDGAQGLANQLLPQLNAAEAKLRAYITIRDQMARSSMLTGEGTFDARDYRAGNAKPDAPFVSGGADTKAAKVSVSDYTDEIMRLNTEMLKLSTGDGGYPRLAAATEKYVKDLIAGKKINGEQATAMFNAAKAADELAVRVKVAADAWEEYAKEATKGQQEKEQAAMHTVALAQAVLAENDALRLEHATLGMDDNARAQWIVNMQLAAHATDENQQYVEQLTEKLKLLQQQAADRSMITYQENWKNTAREIGDSLTDAFMRAFESGKDFGKSLVNSLKSMFSKLVLQPIIQGVMSPIAGSITGAGGGMLGYSSSANASSFGGFNLSGLGSYFSQNPITNSNFVGPPTESQYYMGEAGSYLGAAAMGYGIGSVAHELAGNNRNQAGMQGGATVGAMIGTAIAPGIGTVIGALIGAIAGSFIKSGGGPKVGGYGAAGNIVPWNRKDEFVGSTFMPGHFTPNQEDGAMADAARSWIKNFDKLVESYGGTKGRGGFDIGRYSDPKGTTDNALGVRGFVNGQQTFNYWNNSLGRDDAAMQAEIALVTQRALIAGLQKSDIASQISAVFNTLDANALTQGQIDNVLAFADAMQQVIDAIGGDVAADAATTWANSQRSSVEALVDMGKEVIRLADEFDGSTESMQSLATASKSYRSAVEQVLIAIRTVAQQAQSMQGSLVQSIQTAGMSWDQGFSYWANIADQQAALLANAKSPEEVSKISTAYYTALGNAFSAVPAEFQNTYKAPLLGALAEFGDGVEAVLKKIGVDTVAGTESPFAAANKALNDAAGKFDTSAATMSDAAADMKLAAADMKSAVADFRAAMPLQVQVSYADHLV